MKHILLTLSLLFLVGCNTTKIGAPKVIALQANVTGYDVQQAVKKGIYNSRGWIVESSNARQTIAGVTSRSHYIQVTYEYGNGNLISRISGSSKMKQSKTRIHEKALIWKRRLDENVMREVGMIDPQLKPITLSNE